MTSLRKTCLNTAAVVGIAVAVAGCGRKDEYSSSGAASPATSPYASAAPGAEGGVGTFTDSMEITADVIGVDEDAKSITVTAAETGPPADKPGADADAGTDAGAHQGARGTAGAIADRRTLPVSPAAAEVLSRLKPGDRVTLSCSTDPAAAGTTGSGSAATVQDPSVTIPSPGLEGCATVAAITPRSDGNARGR